MKRLIKKPREINPKRSTKGSNVKLHNLHKYTRYIQRDIQPLMSLKNLDTHLKKTLKTVRSQFETTVKLYADAALTRIKKVIFS